MSEADAIARSRVPVTRRSIASDLQSLGLEAGTVALVHSSLSSLGWVCGGPVAVIQALLDVLGEQGTLVMPAHSGELSDPAEWQNPPVPAHWLDLIREEMPAYSAICTPTRGMGRIAELFRTWPGTRRSAHPAVSFAAHGPAADFIVGDHRLDDGLGDGSPLGRLYDVQASVVLLGVGHDSNTSMHLAEYRAGTADRLSQAAPVIEDGRRVWKSYTDILLDSSRFPAIGADFEAMGGVRIGSIGAGTARLFGVRAVVDFAVNWLLLQR